MLPLVQTSYKSGFWSSCSPGYSRSNKYYVVHGTHQWYVGCRCPIAVQLYFTILKFKFFDFFDGSTVGSIVLKLGYFRGSYRQVKIYVLSVTGYKTF